MESYINNNFYTPDISEFHVGFEFEYFDNRHKVWRKSDDFIKSHSDWDTDSLEDIKFQLEEEPQRIKVKYLDSEDIKELGWVFNYDTDGGLHFFYKEAEDREGRFVMYHVPIQNRIEITEDNYSDEYTIFDGFIYNKSELKWLMKRLGIL